MEQIKNHNKMSKPNKLLAGFLFLYISYFIVVLNLCSYIRGIEHVTDTAIFDLEITYQTILFLIALVWLTYEIGKGSDWLRYYLLIFIIAAIPRLWFELGTNLFLLDMVPSFQLGVHKSSIIDLLHKIIPLVSAILGLLLLFSKDSSNWFKQVKQSNSYKKTISNSIKISSICFYFAYGITVLSYVIFLYEKIPSSRAFTFFYLLGCLLLSTCTINILFIYAISKGRKLLGIIYLMVIFISQLSCFIHLAADLNFYNTFLQARPYNFSFGMIFGFIQIPIQLIAFILFFQNDIINQFRKLLKYNSQMRLSLLLISFSLGSVLQKSLMKIHIKRLLQI